MEDKEPLPLPFNAVEEFKAYMKLDSEKIFNLDVSVNSSITDNRDNSVDENDSSKENSFASPADDSFSESVISSHLVSSNNIPVENSSNTSTGRTRYSRRAKKNSAGYGDIPAIVKEDIFKPPSPKRRGRRKNNLQATIENANLAKSNDIIAIDDDSDDDACCIVETTTNRTSRVRKGVLDADSINEEMNIKISWLFDGAIKYRLRKFEPFSKIFAKLAEEKKVDANCIVLMKDDVKIHPEDTPDSINLTILDVLNGYTSTQPTTDSQSNKMKTKNSNSLEVKVITDSKRNSELYFSINKGQKMLVLLVKIAEKLNYDLNDIQLWFDGERVNEQDTTTDLDLEGNECFELRLKVV